MAVDSAISSIANSSSSYSATSKGKTSGSDLDKEAFLNLLVTPVSYTHLDVYKRQLPSSRLRNLWMKTRKQWWHCYEIG